MRVTTATALLGIFALLGCTGSDPDAPADVSPPSSDEAIEQRHPDVIDADVELVGDTYTFDVTISSPYDTPDRYADGWRIKDDEGNVYAEHTLMHDHAAEQPFTRTQTGVSIPADVSHVIVEARDLRNGYGGTTKTVELPEPQAMVPLALAVHPTREVANVPLTAAQSLLDGGVDDWEDLGYPAETITVVTSPNVDVAGVRSAESAADALDEIRDGDSELALVPASAVDPTVRVLPVDAIHPLRALDEYPLRVPVPTEHDSPESVTTVTVVGDIMLGRRVGESMASSGDFAAPMRPLADRLSAADLTIGNLESTLSTDGSPTQGGDSFAADPAVEEGLSLAGFDVLSLANNHVGDWGDAALEQTIERVRSMGIEPAGAGADLAEAREPVITERDGTRIGVIAFDSIGESPAAGRDRPGTNRLNMPPRTGPLDDDQLDRVLGDVRALRPDVDLLLVIPHWGTQYTNRPEDSQREVAAALAEAGADLVIGGHPHWVQGWESVGDTVIVHSLGNFVFDMEFSREVQEGVFVEIVMWDDVVMAVEPVPYVIGDDHAPQRADTERARAILDLMWEESRPPFKRP